MSEPLATWPTENQLSSRPSRACRPSVSRTNWSVTSPSSWGTPTPRSTRPPPRPPMPNPLSSPEPPTPCTPPEAPPTPTPSRIPRPTSPTTSAVTSPSWIVPATISSWPPCSTERRSWTEPSSSWRETRPAPSPRPPSTSPPWRSCASKTSSYCRTRSTSSRPTRPWPSRSRFASSSWGPWRTRRPSFPSPPCSSTTSTSSASIWCTRFPCR
mmetsp:Transcript_18579/g.28146  ORF Transcript_18579/g.28146 Transcript_18579/m.28146 type:complete len:212 (+) Transcript_18579:169-804(+)